VGDLRDSDHLEDQGVDGRVILKLMLKQWDGGGMAWFYLVQDRERWGDLVNTVMNLWVP